MKDEPDDPTPYLVLSEAYKRGKIKLPEALLLNEKALELLVAGQMRLHGDRFGTMTKLYLPLAYTTAAELAGDEGQYARALAYAKAAEAMDTATQARGFEVEAQIWEALGRNPDEKAALVEAWKRGSQAAFKKLGEQYPEVVGNNPVGAPDPARKDAPAFRGTTLDGKPVDSAQLRGKIVVANFWYTGCLPCKAEIPDLNRLVKKFQGRAVVFLAFDINDDEDEGTLRRFLKEYPFDYAIVPHASKIAAQFGMQVFPAHVVVNREGKIESKLQGGGSNVAELDTVLARLVEKP
jgi:thiol-disulfide isomerase/thioredoxin